MSARLVKAVWGSELRPTDRLVAAVLAWHANDDGDRIWPSQARIAQMTGLTSRGVRNSLRRLIDAGIIDPLANMGGGAPRGVSYHMDARRLADYPLPREYSYPGTTFRGQVDVDPPVDTPTETTTPERGSSTPERRSDEKERKSIPEDPDLGIDLPHRDRTPAPIHRSTEGGERAVALDSSHLRWVDEI